MVSIIVVAAGDSSRMGNVDKQFAEVGGVPVIAHTLLCVAMSNVDEIIIVTKEEKILLIWDIIREFTVPKVKTVIVGGNSRSRSVENGLAQANGDIVLIHDGARCLVDYTDVNRLIDALKTEKAATLAYPVIDTLKYGENGYICQNISRDNLWHIATPQGFKTEIIKKAYENSPENTDDTSLMSAIGVNVKLVECSRKNFKITTAEDLELVENILC